MAYQSWQLVSRLRLHSSWRKPRKDWTLCEKCHSRVDAYRTVAWRIMELCLVGSRFWSASFVRAIFMGKMVERMPSIISHLYLLFIILLSFILFSADTIPQAMQRIGGLFGAGKLPVISVQSVYYLRSYGLLLIFAAIAATPLPVTAFNRFMKTKAGSILNWVMPIVLVGLFLLATAFLVDGSYNPFLYFRF